MEDQRRARPPARFSTRALQVAGFYSAEARKRGEHDRLGRAGGRRGLVTDEVAARGVMGTRGVVAKPFSLGSGRRLTLQGVECGRAVRENGRVHRPA
jgi:hypothetical protein